MNLPFLEMFNSLDELSFGRALSQRPTILEAQRLADALNEDADGPIRARAVWIDFDGKGEDSKQINRRLDAA